MAERPNPSHSRTGAGGRQLALSPLDLASDHIDAPPADWEALETPTPAPIPQRYRLRTNEDGTHLSCDEAPRMEVRIQRDYSFTEAEARELGKRIILLDGAGRFGPLLDNKAKLYNLDHHEGCERTFTLATCEQALLLVQSGLELSQGDWTVYANEPDLDTCLAIWCLLNYVRLPDLRPETRNTLFPMIRLEGAIDANGNELSEYCGLTQTVLEQTRKRLDLLLDPEREVKKRGQWQEIDFEEFTLEVLTAIDNLVYSIEDFREYASLEEVYGHTEIGKRRVAVVCKDAAGIYEVEKLLKARWGDQLAVIVLEKAPGHYTLRRASALSSIDLDAAYATLNLLDRNVDGRPPGKRWGGSDSIGGSPRPSGSALDPRKLLRTLALAYRPASRLRALKNATRAAVWSGVVVGIAALAGLVWGALPGVVQPVREETLRLATSAAAFCLVAPLLAWRFSERRTWLFGFRRPAGREWAVLAPLAVLLAVPVRAWFPQEISLRPVDLAASFGAVVLAAAALEFWFRGVVHGLLLFDSRLQTPGGPWGLSLATLFSAMLYAAVGVALSLPRVALEPSPFFETGAEIGIVAAASALGGLVLGSLRERSLSVWPGVLAQIAGGVVCAAFWLWIQARF